MQLRRHLRLFTIFSQTAYPSPLNAARPSSDSLRSPTPGRLASVNLAARQFLAIAYFASLVTASDLAGLTALNASRFHISRTGVQSFVFILNFLNFLNFLKLLIVCHVLPSDLRLCRDTRGMDIPGLAVSHYFFLPIIQNISLQLFILLPLPSDC
jgi:hypothetical protein